MANNKPTVMTPTKQQEFLDIYGNIFNQSMACVLVGIPLATLESFKRANPDFRIKIMELKANIVGLSVSVLKRALSDDNVNVANRILNSKLNKESDLEEVKEEPNTSININIDKDNIILD